MNQLLTVSDGGGMRISKFRMAKYFFFFSFFLYILSVSRFMVTQETNIFYFIKHIVILLPSSIAFFIFLIRGDIVIKRDLVAVPLFLSLVIIIYLLRGAGRSLSDVLVFFQFSLFLCSCYFYADQLFSREDAFSKKDFFIFGIILSIPSAMDILLQGGTFIFNSYYGRDRLLLGFFHPKEAAISILTVILLFRCYISHTLKPKINQFFILTGLILLYFVQSRNSFLFFLNFTLINILLIRVRVSAIIGIYFVFPFLLIGMSLIMFYEQINQLSSSRLEFWIKQFNFSLFGGGTRIGDYGVVKNFSTSQSDNFYLQYLLENGIVFFVILIIFLSIVVHKIGKLKFNGIYVNAIFISFLAYCFFDAGMFSSGNFFNLVIWSMVFATLRKSIVSKKQGIDL